ARAMAKDKNDRFGTAREFIEAILPFRTSQSPAANRPNSKEHLEYGDQWLLVVQTIDAIEDPARRNQRQAKLVDILMSKLQQSSREAHLRSPGKVRFPHGQRSSNAASDGRKRRR